MLLNSINKNWNIILRGFHPSSLIKVQNQKIELWFKKFRLKPYKFR